MIQLASIMAEPATESRRYRAIAELGRGGMSKVYLATTPESSGLPKLVAVKVLLQELASDPEFVEMFFEEARLSARLHHPNIVQIYELGAGEVDPYILMEFLDGVSMQSLLRASVKRHGALPLPLQLRIIAEAAKGLHYAHEYTDVDGSPLEVVHRDVSPHNIYVTYEGEVKILDFGIAKASDSVHRTRTGVVKGKCAYMAPEQVADARNLDRRVDIFALGVILWQAIAGVRMWAGKSELQMLESLLRGAVPPLPDRAAVPSALLDIVERATEVDRNKRIATGAELARSLEAYLATLPAPSSLADLGAFTADLFTERREKIRTVIEAKLNRPPRSGTSSTSVSLTVPPISQSSRSIPNFLGNSGSVPIFTPTSPANSLSRVNVHEVGEAGRASSAALEPAPSPRPASSSARAIALVVCLVLALAGGVLIALALGAQRRAVEVVDVPPSALAPPTAPVEQQLIELTVTASPQDAEVFLDGVRLDANPSTLKLALDHRHHEVRAEAKGYRPKVVSVVYDEPEKRITLQLAKERE